MSRFVAAGTSASYEPPKPASSLSSSTAAAAAEGGATEPTTTTDEWSLAQQQLESARQRREEQSRAQQQSGSSLYEVLQANKAAKQDALTESLKLKHQFRSLNDDEISFLDSLNDASRAKEEEVKREEMKGLAEFRKMRQNVDKAERGDGGAGVDGDDGEVVGGEEVVWTAGAGQGRKRKKGGAAGAMPGLKGVKVRRVSSAAEAKAEATKEKKDTTSAAKATTMPAKTDDTAPLTTSPVIAQAQAATSSTPPKATTALSLALGGYSSDED